MSKIGDVYTLIKELKCDGSAIHESGKLFFVYGVEVVEGVQTYTLKTNDNCFDLVCSLNVLNVLFMNKKEDREDKIKNY